MAARPEIIDMGMKYKYITLKKFGGPEVLEVAYRDSLPEPGNGQVRVRVLASSAAFTDTLIRRGIYPDVKENPPLTPGYDMVGEVDKLGPGVTAFEVGQKVAELTITGAYTQYMILPASQLVRVPDGISPVDAVALILSYVTAYQMLTRSVSLKMGQSILIHGAGGTVGSALVQLGSMLKLKIYGTAADHQQERLRSHGCYPIDYRNDDFVEVIRRLEKQGLDAVFDPIGGSNFRRSMKVIGKNGKLVAFGSYHAKSGLGLIQDFLRIKLWNLIPWEPSTTFYSIGAWHGKHHHWFRQDLSKLFQFLEEGKIIPTIAKKMNFEEASRAHELIERGGVKGKVVLIMNES